MALLVFRLLAIFCLSAAIQNVPAATVDMGATRRLFSSFEAVANSSLQPTNEPLANLEAVMEDMRNSGSSVRMLYTYDEQAHIFKKIFGENSDKLDEILEEPDTCSTIETFMGFIFDSAVDLLSHRAGRKHELMRGFQQVLHMRAVLTAVLLKQGRSLNEPVSSEICIDKVFIAIYGWVKGTLIAEARAEGTFIAEASEPTEEQKESLKAKRHIVTTTTLDKELDLTAVKPLPGIDYPE